MKLRHEADEQPQRPAGADLPAGADRPGGADRAASREHAADPGRGEPERGASSSGAGPGSAGSGGASSGRGAEAGRGGWERDAAAARRQGAADHDVAAAATSRTAEDRERDREFNAPGPDEGPDKPSQLKRKGLFAAVKRTFRQFSEDNISDWAAALTYYGVLSIFPAAVVLVSLLGMLGNDGQKTVTDAVNDLTPNAQLRSLVGTVLTQVGDSGAAGFAAIIGLVVAFWSASGYVAAFMRASNAVYDVPEGRPIWKTLPIRVGVTAVIGIMLIASAAIVIFTGELSQVVGERLGFGGVAVTTWNIAKWPVLVVLVSLMFALLYWASPNAKTGGFRWITPGGIFAVVLWVAASAAFAFYLGNFASYDKTYGTLAGVIAFLVWLWISNMAILLGAELDAELERGRAIAAGHPADDEPFLELRDTRKIKKGSEHGLSQG